MSTRAIKITLAILFASCLLDWQYGYYQLVRFLGMIGFGYLAWDAYNNKEITYAYIYGLSAVLINPIFKIALGRTLWNVVDVIWAVFLVYTLLNEKRAN
jgi:hypothetical protein